MQSPHEILGVEPDASEAEIERAYRRRIKETHPDQGGSVAEFLQVRSAYEQLQEGHTTGGDPAGGAGPDAHPGRHSGRTDRRRNGHDRGDRRRGDRTGRRRRGRTTESESESTGTVVEYLNYDVLVDRDWQLYADGDGAVASGDTNATGRRYGRTNGDDDRSATGDGGATGEGDGGDNAGGDREGDADEHEDHVEDLFERAAEADLDPADYGRFVVEEDETLLEAAERNGHEWPYSCRGGACANCAVAVLEGELSTPVNHILPDEMLARDLRLSCVGEPVSDRLRVVFNVKHLPELDELRLPPHPSS